MITPNLWFDGKAEEAAEFCVSTFPRQIATLHVEPQRRAYEGE